MRDFNKFTATLLLGASLFALESAAFGQSQQCVTNALAGGTADAITVPLLPCALSTNILLLTLTATNATTTPTLQMAGYPALPIQSASGGAIGIGSLASGTVVQLTSTGTAWRLLTNGQIVSTPVTVPQGGTGDTTLGTHGVLVGEGTSAVNVTAAGTTGQVLTGSSGADPAFTTLSAVTVTSLSFGTTGLTPSSATTGAITVAGDLVVANGGTGTGTITGLVKGNGTSAMTAATAGSDYCVITTSCTWTAEQLFSGTSSNLAMSILNAAEPSTISATAATGSINYDFGVQSVIYYTTNATSNWTLNFRYSSGSSLNTIMTTGQAMTAVFAVQQGTTAYYNNSLQIDGTTAGVTVKCQGGCPVAGNTNGTDIYTYAVLKTGNAAYTVLESQVQFK